MLERSLQCPHQPQKSNQLERVTQSIQQEEQSIEQKNQSIQPEEQLIEQKNQSIQLEKELNKKIEASDIQSEIDAIHNDGIETIEHLFQESKQLQTSKTTEIKLSDTATDKLDAMLGQALQNCDSKATFQ